MIGAIALLGIVSCRKADKKFVSDKDTVKVLTTDSVLVVKDTIVKVDTLRK